MACILLRNLIDAQYIMAQMPNQQFNFVFILNSDVWSIYCTWRCRITEQLRLHEPSVYPDQTKYTDGLLFTDDPSRVGSPADSNHLKLTVALQTVFKEEARVELNSEEAEN